MIKTLQKYTYTPPKNGYPEWNNNPEIFQLNRLDAHATLIPYETLTESLKGERKSSNYYLSLNCDWKFSFSETPDQRIQTFYETDYDDRTWNEIKVPSHW